MKSPPQPAFAVAVVDDDRSILDAVTGVLHAAGITNTVVVQESSTLLEVVGQRDIGMVLMDLAMPGLSGEELIPLLKQDHPGIPIIVITANHEVDKAVACMKAGVDDYLTKPFEPAKLIATVRRFVEIQELRRENAALGQTYLSADLRHPEAFSELVTADAKMRRLFGYAETVAATRHVVLITGETGVGKELMARAIHGISGRAGAYVTVNVAGLDESMFADTLFGHRMGAFTGASARLSGLIEKASGGTLFLDEIGDLALGSQIKLLRLLESGEYYPLGSDIVHTSNARIIVATNVNVAEGFHAENFRKDLYYRIKTHHINIPPLRERPLDIPLLLRHFISASARELGRKPPEPSPPLIPLLLSHSFPGNVRELKSMVFDAMSRHVSGDLSVELFETGLAQRSRQPGADGPDGHAGPKLTIKETVDRLVEEAMKSCNGNMKAAARILGITPQALGQRLKRRTLS